MEESNSSWLSSNAEGKHTEGRNRDRLPRRNIETLLEFAGVKVGRPQLS